MQREIKFRGKRIDNGEWVYGSLILFGERSFIYQENSYHEDFHFSGDEVDPSTVGQFTGIKDKNGNEIYEGQPVRCRWLAELGITEIDCEADGVVQWDKVNPCFYIQLDKTYKRHVGEEMIYEETALGLVESSDEGIDIEIIGNIYTPEQ